MYSLKYNALYGDDDYAIKCVLYIGRLAHGKGQGSTVFGPWCGAGIAKKAETEFGDCCEELRANMPENDPLLDEPDPLLDDLYEKFDMKKEDKREFVIRAHIIEAKGMQEALRKKYSQTVGSTELSIEKSRNENQISVQKIISQFR